VGEFGGAGKPNSSLCQGSRALFGPIYQAGMIGLFDNDNVDYCYLENPHGIVL
jgi:hypothetical protein